MIYRTLWLYYTELDGCIYPSQAKLVIFPRVYEVPSIDEIPKVIHHSNDIENDKTLMMTLTSAATRISLEQATTVAQNHIPKAINHTDISK